jgi:hypothetical protein
MAQPHENPRVPLLATVVLLLDDEAETVGTQLIRLCHTLDPLARARLQILRVKGAPTQLLAAPLIENQRALIPAGAGLRAENARLSSYGVPGQPYAVSPMMQPGMDVNDTRPAIGDGPEIGLGSFHPFEIALRGAIQDVSSSGGPEPLAARGYAMVPNEFAVYLVGRTDDDTLPRVAMLTQQITRAIAPNTDARRYALLLAAPPDDDPRFAASNPGQGYGQSWPDNGNESEWRNATANQPWRELLSWQRQQGGEPPLHYAFVYEPWDEASRYHWRNELYYAMAESLFALFATGMLENTALKDALDLSSAALETGNALTRIGSIGTSLITTPTQSMIDYLAHRLATDVLLRRGLMGTDGGFMTPDRQHAIDDQAQQDAARWLATSMRTRLEPDYYPLPRRLPRRSLENGARGEWFGLAVSKAGPDPTSLVWRWQSGHLYLDDERFWNLAVQNEYETIGDACGWDVKTATALRSHYPDLRRELVEQIRLRTLGPEGVERARAFAQALGVGLAGEERRLDDEANQQAQQIEQHHRRFEDELRRVHPGRGIPGRANPPAREMEPQMPRNLEVLTHEVIDAQFARTPMPLTLVMVGLLLALIGAFATYPIASLPFVSDHLAFLHTLTGAAAHWFGAGVFVALFAVALVGPIWQMTRLNRWEKRYAAERTLLWLNYAKSEERSVIRAIVAELLQDVEQASQHIDSWMQDIDRAAAQLTQQAEMQARDYSATAALSRDIFIANGIIWEGVDPNALYLQVRQQLDDQRLIAQFLQYTQAHAGDVVRALSDGTIGIIALDFTRAQLRVDTGDHPFAQWEQATAQQVLARAIQAARVPLQPQLAGQPLGHFDAVAVYPTVPWVARLAGEHNLIVLAAPTDQWCLVARVVTRAQHALVR